MRFASLDSKPGAGIACFDLAQLLCRRRPPSATVARCDGEERMIGALGRWLGQSAAAGLLLAAAPAAVAPAAAAPTSACTGWIAEVERTMRIPHAVLLAVGLVESGWQPFAVDYGGQPVFYPSARAATDAVGAALAEGRTNIDVGCLQINLGAHPDVFASLDEAFDPRTNVLAGARLLVSLARASGGWSRAIELYHSADPALGRDYFCRFHAAYVALRKLRPSPASMAYCRTWLAKRAAGQAR